MAILHSTAVAGSLVRSTACREVRQAAFVSPTAATRRHGGASLVTRVVPAATEVITAQDKSIIEALERKFKIADVDGNGSIDREELRNLLESTDGGDAYLLTQHWYPEDELDRIMALYDKDSSGSITLDEFQQLVYDGLLLENKLEEYEEAFNAVDTSRNGTIGAMELGKVFAAVGEPMSYEKLVDIMQKYDKDESGQIDFPEFLLMCRDNLIDFKDLQKYVSMTPKERAENEASLVEADSGDLMLIFSESELDEIVASASAKGKLVVVFGALTWCRPCKGVQRPVQRMAELYKDTVTFVKLFGNANNQTKLLFKDRFKVRSTPCFIAIRDGQVVANRTGANKEKLEAFIRDLIPADKLPTIVLYPPGYQ